MNNLQRTQVVDKNNRVTHVHKNVEKATPANQRATGVDVAPSVPTPVNTADVPIPTIGGSVQLAGYNFETSEIFYDEVLTASGDVLYNYNESFDYPEYRAPYLAGEDGITAVATRKLPSDIYNYDIDVSMFDGNTGGYNVVTMKDFSTGLGWDKAPSVGDIIGTYAQDAYIAEEYPLTDQGVKDFADNFGYEPDDDNRDNPWEAVRNTLEMIHSQSADFKKLVGEVRYGDYVFGRYKADYGYEGGIEYVKE